jgi:hypothetical protein
MDLKEMLVNVIELKKLNNQYGWQSCFDVPDAYDQMENLASEIHADLENAFPNFGSITHGHIKDNLESIASDFLNNNWNTDDLDDIEIHYYSLDEYIEIFVLEGLDEQGRQLFDSLFYWMNSDDRGKWLYTNYVQGESNTYTNIFHDYFIEVRN